MVIFVKSVSKVVVPCVHNHLSKNHLSQFSSHLILTKAEKREYKCRKSFLNQYRQKETIAYLQNIYTNSVDIPVKKIEIQACASLYNRWKDEVKFYKKAPKEGLSFNVEYVDTKEMAKSDSPSILALHGAPGCYGDFNPLISHLATTGARIIAPNFPDYSATDRTKYYRHTVEEKAHYLKGFLHSIDVKNLDMIVAHSSAIYPGIYLSKELDVKVKSFAMINPSGHRRIKAMKPKWFIDGTVKVFLNPVGRWLFRRIGGMILAAKGVAVRIDNVDNVILAATAMYFSKSYLLKDYLLEMNKNKTPLVYIFSENDKLVEKEIFHEMADFLGAKESNYTKYDENANCLQKASKDEHMEIIRFEKGGHYAFLKYASIVNPSIEQFLERLKGEKKMETKRPILQVSDKGINFLNDTGIEEEERLKRMKN